MGANAMTCPTCPRRVAALTALQRIRAAMSGQGSLQRSQRPESPPETHSADTDSLVVAETSNPGPVGRDTGYVFYSPRSRHQVRVIARAGEKRETAIARVRARHGL
jgi:hypothetical protein